MWIGVWRHVPAAAAAEPAAESAAAESAAEPAAESAAAEPAATSSSESDRDRHTEPPDGFKSSAVGGTSVTE